MLGSWGNLVFSVSADFIKTFDAFKRSESTRWSKHDIHLRKTKPEFTGIDQGKITFTMKFSASFGVNPMKEIDKLIRANRSGEAHTLIVGNKRFGVHKYYIASINADMNYWENKGHLLSADVNITMEEYV